MTDIEICNLALLDLGCTPILTFDDASDEGRACKLFYPACRDVVLADSIWTFAKLKFKPTQLTTAPAFGFAKAFQLPSEVLRVYKVDDGTDSWDVAFEVVGRQIHSDAETLYALAVQRIADTSQFSPGFVMALAARLAADMAVTLTGNRTLRDDNLAIYEKKRKAASEVDGAQGKTERVRASRLAERR